MSEDRVEVLEQRVAELTRSLEELQSQLVGTSSPTVELPTDDDGSTGPMSRRAALRAAGVAAAAAIAGGVGAFSGSERAGATSTITANYFTETANGAAAIYADGDVLAKGVDATSDSASAVFGRTIDGYGIYGTASGFGTAVWAMGTSGNAIYAQATDSDAILAFSPSNSALNATSGGNTIQVSCTGDATKFGVWSLSDSATGIYGQSGSNVGVSGRSNTSVGVMGETSGMTAAGVQGTATTGYGVLGISSSGLGVQGRAPNGTGVSASGSIGVDVVSTGPGVKINAQTVALRLTPSQVSDVTTLTALPGDVAIDSQARLWFNSSSGWKLLAGGSTSGAFTPISPARAYDSRRSAYAQYGPIANGANRTISVADSHNADGTVLTTGVVPAGATAVAANVTVVNTIGVNNFCINRGGDTSHPASTINWFASGQTLANGVVLALDDARRLTIVAGGQGGSADVIIDITGYWL